MELSEAIETLKFLKTQLYDPINSKEARAYDLGIEALKRLASARYHRSLAVTLLLPGEIE